MCVVLHRMTSTWPWPWRLRNFYHQKERVRVVTVLVERCAMHEGRGGELGSTHKHSQPLATPAPPPLLSLLKANPAKAQVGFVLLVCCNRLDRWIPCCVCVPAQQPLLHTHTHAHICLPICLFACQLVTCIQYNCQHTLSTHGFPLRFMASQVARFAPGGPTPTILPTNRHKTPPPYSSQLST